VLFQTIHGDKPHSSSKFTHLTGKGFVMRGAGLGIWLTGFIIESVADYQKSVFRSDPANKGRFIQSGIWKHSRHPNYFGEILVWWGVYVTSLGSLTSYQPAGKVCIKHQSHEAGPFSVMTPTPI
jgi:steroid 5-alpha reductase family enzyme